MHELKIRAAAEIAGASAARAQEALALAGWSLRVALIILRARA